VVIYSTLSITHHSVFFLIKILLKMKKFFVFAAFAVLALTSATVIKPVTYKMDASKSTFKWTGKKVTGTHWGYIKFTDGSITTDGTNVTGGSFNVDMNSMDVQDIPAEKGGGKLLGHLKSDDFFGTEKFPTSTLTIKSATAKGGGQFDVKADLTIKGTTSEVMFPATISMDGKTLTAKAAFKVDRTKYGIKYGSGSFFENLGDKAISNDFDVEVDIAAAADMSAATVAPAAAPAKKKMKAKTAKKSAAVAPAKG
jgi:polyisoprenoid-binding protein YceI